MGLACPVCEVPHPDGEHLADHVAVTAATREGDHRAWLDEHAPDWGELTRTELAAMVADRAEEVDSVDLHEELGDHRHDREHPGALAGGTNPPGDTLAEDTTLPGELDEEARAVLAEARELTEQMLTGDGNDEE